MTVATRSPTTNTGSSWTNPTYAYDDGGAGAATITSAKPSGNNVWGTYGFSLTGSTITQVRVRYDALTGGNEQIRIDVSWDGGTTWSAQQVTALTDTETTYWYDVTAETAWTPAKLADGQLQVRADAYTVGGAGSVSLDWLPVEVTYSAAGVTVTPGLIALVLTTFIAVVTITANQVVTPDTLAHTITAFLPTVTATDNKVVTPDALALTTAPFIPTVSVSDNKLVTPDALAHTINLYPPTVTATENQLVTPDTLALSTTLFIPTVTVGGDVSVTPDTLALLTSAFIPTVTATGGTYAILKIWDGSSWRSVG